MVNLGPCSIISLFPIPAFYYANSSFLCEAEPTGKVEVELRLFSLIFLLCFWYLDPHLPCKGGFMAVGAILQKGWEEKHGLWSQLWRDLAYISQGKSFGLIVMLMAYFKWSTRTRHCSEMLSMKRSVCASGVTQIEQGWEELMAA